MWEPDNFRPETQVIASDDYPIGQTCIPEHPQPGEGDPSIAAKMTRCNKVPPTHLKQTNTRFFHKNSLLYNIEAAGFLDKLGTPYW